MFEMFYMRYSFSPYQQICDNYIIRSLNHEIYLQRVQKSTLSQFGEANCYECNNESKPWK